MQNVGNGSTTKTILEFLNAEGPATLYSNVVHLDMLGSWLLSTV
ncbi:UNVERIFIED_CONTAM: hypothetical protein ABIC26_002624 [Paenibacillus sp. PvR008]